MRLPVRLVSMLRPGRRLGRGALVSAAALACVAIALVMAAGSSQSSWKPLSWPGVSAHSADMAPATTAVAIRADGDTQRRRPGAAYYRRTARRRVPARTASEFLPLYREAERVYGVSWRLIASIHRQETAFSTAPSTYRGLNDFGCCAGPMQFNVTNGPVSTWERYRKAYRDGRRPERYPHRTRRHPSIYDDFDAIMAAGSLLIDLGAGRSLDSSAWSAAYGYYGHDLFSVTYASQVLARAEAWRRDGFCPNCELDEGLVARFDRVYGAPIRRQFIADERRRKKPKREKLDRDRTADRHSSKRRRRRADRTASYERMRRRLERLLAKAEREARRPAPRPRRRKTRPVSPSPPPSLPTSTTPQPPPAPKPAGTCSPLRKLLGC